MRRRTGYVRRASDVEVGAVLKVERDDLTLAVFNVEGEFFVTDDHCTHGPGSLSEGFVEGDVVECNFHGGQFNIKTGAVVGPPCMVIINNFRRRSTLSVIRQALEAAGVEFTNGDQPGVRLRKRRRSKTRRA